MQFLVSSEAWIVTFLAAAFDKVIYIVYMNPRNEKEQKPYWLSSIWTG